MLWISFFALELDIQIVLGPNIKRAKKKKKKTNKNHKPHKHKQFTVCLVLP